VDRKGFCWNKGLAKETDSRVAKYAKSMKGKNKGNVAWNRGLTEEIDLRVKSTSVALTGKNRSEKHSKNISIVLKKYFKNLQKKEIKAIPRNKGKKATLAHKLAIKRGMNNSEVNEKISKSRKEWWKTIGSTYTAKQRKIWGNCAKKNPAWKGGESFEPYSPVFNLLLIEKIRERDNYTCQLCDITEEEHIVLYGRVLTIHHINYDKKNSTEDNLLTMCIACNARVNFNREYWKKYLGGSICQKKSV